MTRWWRWWPTAAVLLALVGLCYVAVTTHDHERLVITASVALLAGAMLAVMVDWARHRP